MGKNIIALIVAAGESRRAGGGMPKQYQMLEGKSLLRRSIEAFLTHPDVTGVMVVVNPAHREHYDHHTRQLTLLTPVHGGATRQQSVLLGLEALATHEHEPDYVLVHDAARPNVTADVISRVITGLADAPAVIPALPVYDTLKHVEEERIIGTIERAKLFRAQTPQGFHFRDLLDAHRKCADMECTDDAAVAENAGLEVTIVAGSEHNYKITTQEDINDARALLEAQRETRVGMGFDAHALVAATADRKHVTLCGIAIESDKVLEGHSDADAGLHALVDAMLGSIAAGDIGLHFPPSDPQWKGMASSRFVTHALELIHRQRGRVIHADITLICEKPHIAPHRSRMAACVAALLDVEESRVSIKATTTEKMGFTGRREGIAAQAVVTVKLPVERK